MEKRVRRLVETKREQEMEKGVSRLVKRKREEWEKVSVDCPRERRLQENGSCISQASSGNPNVKCRRARRRTTRKLRRVSSRRGQKYNANAGNCTRALEQDKLTKLNRRI
jgi:hypothetical protein